MFANFKYYAVLALVGFAGAQSSAQAYSYRHIDRLALLFEKQAKTLQREVHAHFRPTPQFRHLDADVTKLEKLAHHIHDVAHRRGSIDHIRADLKRLDKLYHHIQLLVRDAAGSGRIGFREIVHFRIALGRLGRTLHHLREDVSPVHGHGYFYDPHH